MRLFKRKAVECQRARTDFTSGKCLSELEVVIRFFESQISSSLHDFHSKNIAHRDLKPTNIGYFSRDSSWKLMDLDTAADFGRTAPLSYTPAYAAPEIVKAAHRGDQSIECDPAADMWALGIIAFEIISGILFTS